jgi:chromosome segregation ATPase
MAQIIDEQLYKELDYRTAKDYFEAKSLSVRQVYRYAQIGRVMAPSLGDAKYKKEVASFGVSKLRVLASKAEDQLPGLLVNGQIQLGEEVYSADELNEMPVRDLNDHLKKLSKKVEENEVLNERNKNLQLEKKHLEKEVKEQAEKIDRYRQVSESYDEIDVELKKASQALEEVAERLTKVKIDAVPITLQPRLVTLLETFQSTSERMNERFTEILIANTDPLA